MRPVLLFYCDLTVLVLKVFCRAPYIEQQVALRGTALVFADISELSEQHRFDSQGIGFFLRIFQAVPQISIVMPSECKYFSVICILSYISRL